MRSSKRIVAVLVGVLLVVGWSPAQAANSAAEELTRLMPDDVLFFVSTSGADALEPQCSQTSMGKVCADPGVQAFYTSVKTELLRGLAQEEGQDAADIVNMVLQHARLAARRPIIAGLAGVEVQAGPPICLFVILDAGPRKAEIAEAVTKLEALIQEEEDIVEKQVGSLTMHGLEHEDDVPLYWGWIDDRLVLAINDPQGTVAKHVMAPRAAATDHLAKVPGHGDLLALYYDFPKVWDAVSGFAKAEGDEEDLRPLKAALDQLGITQVKTVVARFGFAGAEMVSDSYAEISGPRTGLLACLKPVDSSMLGTVEPRAVSATALNFDLAGFFDAVMNAAQAALPEKAYAEFREGLAGAESEMGFQIRDGLLKSLGGPVVFYTLSAGIMPEAPTGGVVTVAKLNDPALFEKTMTRIGELVIPLAEGMLQIGSQTDADGRTMHVWSVAPLAVAQVMPTWSIVGDQLVIGSSMPLCAMGAKQVAGMGPGAKSLVTTEGYKEVASRLPDNLVSVTYVDSKTQFNELMMQLQRVWPVATMAARRAEINLPVVIPSLSHIAQEMQPSIQYSYIGPDGLYSHYRGTGMEISFRSLGGISGTAVAAGVLMPALARTRQLSHRMTSGTNLSSIGKACLIYANDHDDKYPPNLEALIDAVELAPQTLVSDRKPDGFDGPSYIYIPGQTVMMNPGNVIAYEDPRYCVDGANVLFLDSHVEFMKPEIFKEEVTATYKRLGLDVPELRFADE